MCIDCTTHGPHVQVQTHQSVRIPPCPLSWSGSILQSCCYQTSVLLYYTRSTRASMNPPVSPHTSWSPFLVGQHSLELLLSNIRQEQSVTQVISILLNLSQPSNYYNHFHSEMVSMYSYIIPLVERHAMNYIVKMFSIWHQFDNFFHLWTPPRWSLLPICHFVV